MPHPLMLKKLKLTSSTRPSRPVLQDLLEQIQKKKKSLFHHGDWKAKVGSQEIPRVIGKFGLGVQNEADKG